MKSAVLVRGPLGLFNGIPTLIEILGEVTGYTALIIKKEQKTFASMCFDTPAAAGQFKRKQAVLQLTRVHGNESTISIISPQHIILTFD